MTKKLRDSAYVNDLVLYRNACEEKKLRFTLSQLENLKSIYSRQKEQEKMYFAVQHMAVPVKTDSVIRNLRKGLELDGHRSQSAPVLSTNVRESVVPERSMSTQLQRSHSRTPRGAMRESASTDGKKSTGAVSFERSADNNMMRKVRTSRRVISPHPSKRRNNSKVHGRKNTPIEKRSVTYADPSSASLSTPSLEQDKSEITSLSEETLVTEKSGEEDGLHHELPSEFKKLNLSYRRSSTWDTVGDNSKREMYKVPRLRDLPPVTINIYESPCSVQDAKEKWQQIVKNIRNSSIRDTRSETEQNKQNQEIRKRWQTTYKEIKRDRITAMVKDSMNMEEGEQLTLVKFLPKSRQSNFIKEAQRTQHRL